MGQVTIPLRQNPELPALFQTKRKPPRKDDLEQFVNHKIEKMKNHT